MKPGELAELRRYLEGLELMERIVERLAETYLDCLEDGRREGAVSRILDGLDVLDRRARRELELEERVRVGMYLEVRELRPGATP